MARTPYKDGLILYDRKEDAEQVALELLNGKRFIEVNWQEWHSNGRTMFTTFHFPQRFSNMCIDLLVWETLLKGMKQNGGMSHNLWYAGMNPNYTFNLWALAHAKTLMGTSLEGARLNGDLDAAFNIPNTRMKFLDPKSLEDSPSLEGKLFVLS